MSHIHPKSDVSTCTIGEGTKVWQFVVIIEGATIGKDCNICAHTLNAFHMIGLTATLHYRDTATRTVSGTVLYEI